MWKASLKVGAVEALTYAAIALFFMIRAGQGSGVWIPLLPLIWLILAGRLWLVLRVAGIFSDIGSWRFVVIAGGISLLLIGMVLASDGAGMESWRQYGWIALPVLAQVAAALLACRDSDGNSA